MNKGEIRTRVLEQVDWNPNQSTEFKAKVDRFINRAYQLLSLEAPFLFFEDEIKLVTAPDASQKSGTSTDRLAVNSADPYVLERTYATSTASDHTTWATDGTWGGRMVEIEKSDGTVIRRRIREVWTTTVSTDTIDRFTVNLPWDNVTDADMKYRIFTSEYYLPADVIDIRSAHLFSNTHYPLQVTTQYDMERYEYLDYRGNETGRPCRIFRGKHFQIDAPTIAPTASLDGTHAVGWLGPDPAGKFDYCYTYVWGKRDSEVKNSNNLSEPLWESAPSPVSGAVEYPGINPWTVIKLEMPNVDHILDYYREYNSSGGTVLDATRKGRSGLRKRIYVRRYSASPVAGMGYTPNIESSEVFHLLAEVNGSTQVYEHDGSEIPAYTHRLKTTHGYRSVRFWPMPDDRYEVDVRTLRRPAPLVNDQDTPRLHVEAIDALIERILVMLYEAQGNPEMAGVARSSYENLMTTISKRYGNMQRLRPRKKAARVRGPMRESRVRFTENS